MRANAGARRCVPTPNRQALGAQQDGFAVVTALGCRSGGFTTGHSLYACQPLPRPLTAPSRVIWLKRSRCRGELGWQHQIQHTAALADRENEGCWRPGWRCCRCRAPLDHAFPAARRYWPLAFGALQGDDFADAGRRIKTRLMASNKSSFAGIAQATFRKMARSSQAGANMFGFAPPGATQGPASFFRRSISGCTASRWDVGASPVIGAHHAASQRQ